MGIVRVLSHQGDVSVTWDVSDMESAAVREAERLFAKARARGATAFEVSQGRAARRVDEFDPAAEQIVLVPRVVGG